MTAFTHGLLATRQMVPDGIERLTIPPGVDRETYLLRLIAFTPGSIPPGANRNMTVDGPDQFWYLLVAIMCISIPGLFLLARIYTKAVVVRRLEVADYFIFTAFPLIVAEVAMGFLMVKWGAGVHQWQVTLDQLFHQLYWANLGQIIYCPLSFLVKTAIVLQYLRLFAPGGRSVNKSMWYGAWATIISLAVSYTALMLWTTFYCNPREAIWNKLTPNAKCNDVNHLILVTGGFNMGSDIVILLVPTRSLWRLDVPLGRKIAVTALFATGLLACAASTMRIVYTVKIAPVFGDSDVSHNGLFIGLWTMAEVSLCFIVACALCLPKLVQSKGGMVKRPVSKASSSFISRDAARSNVSLKKFGPKEQRVEYAKTSIRGRIHHPHFGHGDHTIAEETATEMRRYHLQPPPQQNHLSAAYLSPNTYARSVAAASSVYSQSSEYPHQAEQDQTLSRNSSVRVAPLRVSIYGRDGRYLGARSPARQLLGDEEHLDEAEGEVQRAPISGTSREGFVGHKCVTIPIPPKSPRRWSKAPADYLDDSGRSALRRVKEGEMAAPQLGQEAEMSRHVNPDRAGYSTERTGQSRLEFHAISF